MSEPTQLDLTLPPPPAPAAARRRRPIFAGYSRGQILAGVAILLGLIWGMWVTKTLLAPRQDHIVSARLSAIVGEYVQAQARSASPPEQVQAEMRRFMARLEGELQRRSHDGQVVMVGEAVLSRNVPDITESVKRAVYASGIPFPRPARAGEVEPRAQEAASAAATAGEGPGLPEPIAASPPLVQRTYPDVHEASDGITVPGFAPAASIATFGGADGATTR